jgi:FlaA1/EpsC-like NDP-sugar epimerase
MGLLNRHRLWQVAVDAALVAVAWYATYVVGFQIQRNPGWDAYWKQTILIVVAIKIVCLGGFGAYNKWWRYSSLRDLNALVRAVAIASIALLVAFSIVKFPRGVTIHPQASKGQLAQLSAPDCTQPGQPPKCTSPYKKAAIKASLAPRPARQRSPSKRALLLDLVFTLILLGGARMIARSLMERPRRGSFVAKGKKVLIVGAGDAGNLILREMLSNRLAGYEPIGLIDDDPNKLRYRFQGVKVLGTTAQLPEILRARQPDEVHIALPSAGGRMRAAVVATCRAAGVPVKTLPNVNDLVNGDADLVGQLREVQVEDILGREPVALDPAAVGAYVRGRTVLVTGAGGSIGSELCRQLVRMEVGRLVMADHAENNLFQIDRELRQTTKITLVPEIADVRDPARMEMVFEKHQPAVVFHAAAYKHVPLMEQHPVQALRNNALATRTVARLAARHGVDRFVLVSTDKAVYPKTAMGASKALAEWVVEALGQAEAETTFVAVRFGNVLGSSGSVVPIFREQIARGGPVTVTDPQMTRYFMTIHEAAQLIVQAGGVGRGGDVFVLDMGDPVRIIDLAKDMIRLSGLEPERDIAIEITGIRAGEKLHEGLFEDSEEVERTHHEKLMRARRAPISPEWLEAELDAVERLANDGDEPGALTRVRAMIANPRRADSEQPAVAAPV